MNKSDWEASIEKVGVVVSCLVKQDGKYLMVKEQPIDFDKPVYNLPAGHVDKGEALEPAAIRETKEETGYDVKLLDQIALYHETALKSVKHVYLAEIIGGEEHPQEGEIMEVAWLSYEVIKTLHNEGKLRAPWVWDIISKIEKQ